MSRLFTGRSTQWINLSSPASLDNAEPFTVGAWVLIGTALNGARLVCKTSANAVGSWQFLLQGNNAPQFQKSYATTGLNRSSASLSISTGQWAHAAVSWDGGADATNVHIYVNGVETLYGGTTNGVGAKTSDAPLLFIAGNASRAGGNLDRPLIGSLECVTFHTRVLSVGEVGQLLRFPGSVATPQEKVGLLFLGAVPGSDADYTPLGNFGVATSAVFVGSYPPINGIGVIPSPQYMG